MIGERDDVDLDDLIPKTEREGNLEVEVEVENEEFKEEFDNKAETENDLDVNLAEIDSRENTNLEANNQKLEVEVENEEFKEEFDNKAETENDLDVNIVEIDSRENTQRGANNSVVNNEFLINTSGIEVEDEIKFQSELKHDKGSLLAKNDSNFTIDSQQFGNKDENSLGQNT